MQDHEPDITRIAKKVTDNSNAINYIYRYQQMLALTSNYQAFLARNIALEMEVRARITAESRPIRVYYYVYLLDQLSYPLVEALNSDQRFELRLIAQTPSQVDFLRDKGYACQLVHSALSEHPQYSLVEGDRFEADVCFSEMPYGVLPSLTEAIRPWMISGGWLPSYADIFPHYELQNSLFCMIHYSYFLANEWVWLKSNPDLNVHYGLPYPNFCWLYFLESSEHLDFALNRNSFGNTRNYVVSGYPKYDAYSRDPVKTRSFSWRFPSDERKRIVYAPHFMRSESTLRQTALRLLELADSGRFEIVFKPHPVYNATVAELTPRFEEHEACQVIRHSDSSQYIFATSDLSIISSVSMHADGLFSGKPFISELSEDNFNHIGKKVLAAAYSLTAEADLGELIERILFDGFDPKKEERDIIRERLATPNGSASKFILDTIASKLAVSNAN